MNQPIQPSGYKYVFLDEGGDFGFKEKGSKYFTLTAVVKDRPFSIHNALSELKYDLYEQNRGQEYFRCTEDEQEIRNMVFERIVKGLPSLRIHSLIIEKRKTFPALYPQEKFYPMMLGYLIKWIAVNASLGLPWRELIVITDTIPDKGKSKIIEKTVKQTLARVLPPDKRYQIHHHASKSCFGLQIADYCNWAIGRKWTYGDLRSYNLIERSIKSEYDIFQTGETLYY